MKASAYILSMITAISLQGGFWHAQGAELADEVRALREQNELLQNQLNDQRKLIEELQQKFAENPPHTSPPSEEDTATKGLLTKPFGSKNLILSGEAGLAFFEQPSKGAFPNSEFRVDEAKLFLDARLLENTFFFTEINITEREHPDSYFYFGEVYIDWENLLSHWSDNSLSVRIGRFDTPFGEEYIYRDAIDNPLISHSLSDIWGVDEGLEFYGSAGKFSYVVAVQNGGDAALRDYTSDKAVIGRIGYQPIRQLGFSLNAMRTGTVSVQGDEFSALWFGNGFFKQIDNRSSQFEANLFEGDVKLDLEKWHLKGAGGFARTSDRAPSQNRRHIFYHYVEGLFNVTEKFYAASRFSQIFAEGGYPLVGGGNFGERMFGNLTEELWRLSLGLGYRWSPDVITKVEYTFNGGHELGGTERDQENMVAAEIAVRF